MTIIEILLIGAGVVLALLGIVEVVAQAGAHTSFLATVILGQDNRTSTSKTFVLMWTLLVGWALISLLIAGQIIKTHSCVNIKNLQMSINVSQAHCGNLEEPC